MSGRIALFALAAVSAFSAAPSLAQKSQVLDFKPGEVIVGYRSDADRRASGRLLKSDSVLNTFNAFGDRAPKIDIAPYQETSLIIRFSSPTGKNAFAGGDPASQRKLVDDLANQIKKTDPRVKYAYPNYLLAIPEQKPTPINEKRLKQLLSAASKSVGAAATSFPNDPEFAKGLQWDFQPLPMGMNAVGAWKTTTGSRNIVVAVLDTGILRSHADIVGSGNVLPGYNFVSDGSGRGINPSDPNPASHGSNVAGIIGAVATNNSLSVAGINWAVSVLPVRVMNEAGNGSMNDLADGILWAAGLPVAGLPRNETPADVINLSLRAEIACDQMPLVKDAITRARAAGAVIVVAAGNDNKDISGFLPASCPGVISVSAHDVKGHLASYSNFGNVSIVAPGGDTDKSGSQLPVLGVGGDGVLGWTGTSQAAPHVAGAIALALAQHEDWRKHPDLIAAAIHDTAVPMAPGTCPHPCGPGQLDAQRLIEYVPTTQKPPLVASIKAPAPVAAKPVETRVASNARDVSGRWLLDDGTTLIIAGDEWRHPSKGTATISVVGPQDLLVRYAQQTSVTCSYRFMLMDSGRSLHLEATNNTQPREYCPVGRLTSGARETTTTSESEGKKDPGQVVSKGIVGRWLMTTGQILDINKGEWSHPSKGSADLIIDGDKLVVQYPQQTGAKCSYRTQLLDNGKTLELVRTNNLQSDDYCPTGRLTATP